MNIEDRRQVYIKKVLRVHRGQVPFVHVSTRARYLWSTDNRCTQMARCQVYIEIMCQVLKEVRFLVYVEVRGSGCTQRSAISAGARFRQRQTHFTYKWRSYTRYRYFIEAMCQMSSMEVRCHMSSMEGRCQMSSIGFRCQVSNVGFRCKVSFIVPSIGIRCQIYNGPSGNKKGLEIGQINEADNCLVFCIVQLNSLIYRSQMPGARC